jgi:hypothetical protein
VQVASLVAKLDCVSGRAWLQSQPALHFRAHNYGPRFVKEKYCPIEKAFLARQCNRQLDTPSGRRQEAPPRKIRLMHNYEIDGVVMFECVNPVIECGI